MTAVEVAALSAAESAGIKPGDVLLAVNGKPIENPGDVVNSSIRERRAPAHLHRSARDQVAYVRCGARGVRASLVDNFVLAAVGLFTLLVGASVRLRRPRDPATLHFFWLCVVFFGAFVLLQWSVDRLDWTFYWGDAVSMALLPPLLLHFARLP